jgi:exosortase C (VPDSG-CTERM-specific)
MNDSPAALPATLTANASAAVRGHFRPKRLTAAIVAAVMLFSVPLYDLVRFATQNDLYSYVLLIPFISLYLAWGQRHGLATDGQPNRIAFGIAVTTASSAMIAYGLACRKGVPFADEDSLAVTTLSFVLVLIAACAGFLSRKAFRKLFFPLAFLAFMAPLPGLARSGIELFMQHGSASVAHMFFNLAGTTVFYQDLRFQLPGISLQVAPECSGLRSSFVLLIVSVLTSYLFLRAPLNRALLIAAVLPLALVRNGFRIFTIGELCVHVGPDMVDSQIHHQGGPIFFALSLIPFFLLLIFLVKREPRPPYPHRVASQ